MAIATEWFAWLSAFTGAAFLFAGMLSLLGFALVSIWRYLQVWHTLILCIGVQLHGREYKERIFWEAVEERAKRSDFAAQNIIAFVERARPNNGADI